MLSVYVFSLVLGGGLLLASVLGEIFGGHAHGALDALHAPGAAQHGGDIVRDLHAAPQEGPDHAASVLSMRTLTYALFGFGAVGSALSWWGLPPAGPTALLFSAAGGMAGGAIVATTFRYLRATESGEHLADDSFVGLPARVTLPLGRSSPGLIVVERGDRRLTLRAEPYRIENEATDADSWGSVVIVDMKDGVARVAPHHDDPVPSEGVSDDPSPP